MYQAAIAGGYSDVPYHLFIDPQSGQVFEGRSPWAPDVAIARADEPYKGVDDAGHAPQGAHAYGDNEESFGVCFVGNFLTDPFPTPVAMRSLVDIYARKALVEGIDPMATHPATLAGDSGLPYPEGQVLDLPVIRPHLTTFATQCPGGLERFLPSIERETQRRMAELAPEMMKVGHSMGAEVDLGAPR